MYHTSILIKGSEALEKEGITPNWFLFGTGPAIIDAFSKGKLDVGYIGLAPTLIGIGKGIRVKCIAGGHVEGTVIVARHDYEPIQSSSGDMGKTLEQLKGKRIGVPRKGSLHDVFLRYYLSQYNLQRKIEVVNFDWADLIPEAMESEQIEAAAGTPPLAVLLSRLYDARIIVPPKLIWPNNPSYGIVTSEAMLENSTDLLSQFVAIHKKACCDTIRNEPLLAARIISNTVGLVDENFVMDTFKVSRKFCVALPREYVKSTLDLTDVLKDLGYLPAAVKDMTQDRVFDFSLIENLHPEPAHYQSQ